MLGPPGARVYPRPRRFDCLDLLMCSCCILLGQDDRRRTLHEPHGILVLQLQLQHHHGPSCHRHTHFCLEESANSQTAKVLLGRGFRAWRIVSHPDLVWSYPMVVANVVASVCIMSILRLHSLYVIANSTDVTWDNVGAATWSAVELNTAIVCACLPTLKPLINIVAPRLLGSTNGTNRGSRYRPHSHLPAGYQEFSSASLSDRRKNASTYRAEVVANAGQDLPRIKIARASVAGTHDREKIINVEHSTTISFSDEPYDRRSSGSVHSTTDTAHWRTVQ